MRSVRPSVLRAIDHCRREEGGRHGGGGTKSRTMRPREKRFVTFGALKKTEDGAINCSAPSTGEERSEAEGIDMRLSPIALSLKKNENRSLEEEEY